MPAPMNEMKMLAKILIRLSVPSSCISVPEGSCEIMLSQRCASIREKRVRARRGEQEQQAS